MISRFRGNLSADYRSFLAMGCENQINCSVFLLLIQFVSAIRFKDQ